MRSSNNQRCGDSTGTYHNRNPAPNSSQYIAGGRAGFAGSLPMRCRKPTSAAQRVLELPIVPSLRDSICYGLGLGFRRTADCSAPVECCGYKWFVSPVRAVQQDIGAILRPESSEEHLPTSIAEVLRLRALKPSVCDRSVKRFAQDDGFVGEYAENTKRAKKSPVLGANGEGRMSLGVGKGSRRTAGPSAPLPRISC
jgi:hypothetical protein